MAMDGITGDGTLELVYGMIHGLGGTPDLTSHLDMVMGGEDTIAPGIIHGGTRAMRVDFMIRGMDGLAHTMADGAGADGIDTITHTHQDFITVYIMAGITQTMDMYRHEAEM